MILADYITELRMALRYPGARAFYFPPNRQLRCERNERLGREIGFGLRSYPSVDVDRVLNSLYGQLVVANSFDRTGVAIDNKDWICSLRAGMSTTSSQEVTS